MFLHHHHRRHHHLHHLLGSSVSSSTQSTAELRQTLAEAEQHLASRSGDDDATAAMLAGSKYKLKKQVSEQEIQKLRLKINGRERKRMHDLNLAMDGLREVMPYAHGPSVRKLSKIATLLLARNYILMLNGSLDEMKRLVGEIYGGHHSAFHCGGAVAAAAAAAGAGGGVSVGVGHPGSPVVHHHPLLVGGALSSSTNTSSTLVRCATGTHVHHPDAPPSPPDEERSRAAAAAPRRQQPSSWARASSTGPGCPAPAPSAKCLLLRILILLLLLLLTSPYPPRVSRDLPAAETAKMSGMK
ncbi:hypothetical protein CRUP_010448 [Coryphaenoides rupestris]|nr:hypothetical protein CRUP_010448 [Coryphaenoides rupestris]